jgi:hypothetical protein
MIKECRIVNKAQYELRKENEVTVWVGFLEVRDFQA